MFGLLVNSVRDKKNNFEVIYSDEKIADMTADIVNGLVSLIYSIFLVGKIFSINTTVETTPLLKILFNYPTLSLGLMVCLIMCVIANVNLAKKFQVDLEKFYGEIVEGNRLFTYFFDLTTDYKLGKTFRIYQG